MLKTEKTTEDKGVGNTKTTPKEVKKEYRQLFFTWNNYTESDIKDIKTYFDSRKNFQYVFQQEIGKEGTKHLQGCFNSKSAIPWDLIKKKFPQVHWEKVVSWNDSVKYCSKSDTRDPSGSVFTNMSLPEPLEHGFLFELASEWQLYIIELLKKKADPRKIHWFCDKKGGMGKTTLARYLCDTYPNEIIYLSGKGADIKHGVCEFVSKHKKLKCAIFDFPRTVEDFVSYQALEEIKNGIFFSGKYEAKMVRYNIPVIIVLANFMPKEECLSADRWDIHEITTEVAADGLVNPDEQVAGA